MIRTFCRSSSKTRGGVLVDVTDGDTAYNASHYRIYVFYDLAKVAINRLAFSQDKQAFELGFLRPQ